jgi:hypothetical protein
MMDFGYYDEALRHYANIFMDIMLSNNVLKDAQDVRQAEAIEFLKVFVPIVEGALSEGELAGGVESGIEDELADIFVIFAELGLLVVR